MQCRDPLTKLDSKQASRIDRINQPVGAATTRRHHDTHNDHLTHLPGARNRATLRWMTLEPNHDIGGDTMAVVGSSRLLPALAANDANSVAGALKHK